jgi:hypothetical protein
VTGVLAVAIVAFLAVGLILPNSWPGQVLRGSAIQTGGDEPTYASATVDGSIAEWDLNNDFFADMYRAGNPNKPVEAKLYLRYDCPSSTMFALVLSAGNWPVETAGGEAEAWIRINGSKVSLTQFAWVDQGYDGDSGHAKGWEAAFSLDQGTFTIQAHTNVYDGGESQTSDSTSIGLTVICGGSTAVDLTYFEAAWNEGAAGEKVATGVTLRWETATELDNVGFNVYRSSSEKGEWIKLNRELIPSQVPPGSPTGATYEFIDKEVESGAEWFYLLEDVDVNGTLTQHGPVQPKE